MSYSWEKFINNRFIFLACRLFVGGLFVFSGLVKIRQPLEEFIVQVEQYALLPEFLIQPFAFTLPYVELIFGTLLILGIWVKLDAIILGLMNLAFIIALSQAMARGIELNDCGCFGDMLVIGETAGQVIVRDLILMIPILYLIFTKIRFFTLDKYLLK